MKLTAKVNQILQENYAENNQVFNEMYTDLVKMIGDRLGSITLNNPDELGKLLSKLRLSLLDVIEFRGLDNVLMKGTPNQQALYKVIKTHKVPIRLYIQKYDPSQNDKLVISFKNLDLMKGSLFLINVFGYQKPLFIGISVPSNIIEFIFKDGPASVADLQYGIEWADPINKLAFRHEMQHLAQLIDKEIKFNSGPPRLDPNFLAYMKTKVKLNTEGLLEYYLDPREIETHIAQDLSKLVIQYTGVQDYRNGRAIVVTYRHMAPSDFLAMVNPNFYILKQALLYRPKPDQPYNDKYFSLLLQIYKRVLVEFDKKLQQVDNTSPTEKKRYWA